MNTAHRFVKVVEWSEEDQVFIGSIPGWLGPCCHGENEAEVFAELGQILDEWLHIYEQEGLPVPPATAQKQYSGKLQLRTGSELHQLLSLKALQNGESLNSTCIRILKRAVM